MNGFSFPSAGFVMAVRLALSMRRMIFAFLSFSRPFNGRQRTATCLHRSAVRHQRRQVCTHFDVLTHIESVQALGYVVQLRKRAGERAHAGILG